MDLCIDLLIFKTRAIYYLFCLCQLYVFPIELIHLIVEHYWNTLSIKNISLCCGPTHIILYNNNILTNTLKTCGLYEYQGGTNSVLGNQYDLIKNFNITNIVCGYHYHIIQANDKLYSCGVNNYGQLGLNHYVDIFDVPRQIDFKKNVNDPFVIKKISCGCRHTMILTNYGLYGCGDNSFKQICLSHNKYNTLNKINIDNVLNISCGDFHTMIQTSNGYYLCGLNVNGQLGIQGIDYSQQLIKINISNIIDVQCGPFYTAINSVSGVYIYFDNKVQKIIHQPFTISLCSFYYLSFLNNHILYTYGKNKLKKTKQYIDHLSAIDIKDVIHIDGHRDYIIIFTKTKIYFSGDSPHLRRFRNMFNQDIINNL